LLALSSNIFIRLWRSLKLFAVNQLGKQQNGGE